MRKGGRPNIIFLMLDTVSAQHLGVFGGPIRMSNLEKIAGSGTVYQNAIAPGTYTLTSHVSIFTGRRVSKIKSLTKNPVRNQNSSTDPLFLKNKYIGRNEPTLATRLSYLGYKTSMFSNNPFITASTGLAEGFSYTRNIFMENKLKYHRTTLRIIGNDFMRENLTSLACHVSSAIPQGSLDRLYLGMRGVLNRKVCNETGAYRMDQGAELTNRIVREYLSSSGSQGHFMFINYMEAHEGYPTTAITEERVSQDRWMYMSGMLDPSGVEVLKQAYAKRLAYLDSRIGRLMETLKEKGVLDNAVVVLASDHGQAFMEHGLLYHTLFPYQEISRVPLITARFESGRQTREPVRIEKPVSLSSLYGSIISLGYGKSDKINGEMLSGSGVFSDHTGMLDVWDIPLLRRLRKRSRHAERIYKTKMKYNMPASAFYKGQYKMIHYGGRMGRELYDLDSDPMEKENIIGSRRDVALSMLRDVSVA